MSNVGLIPVLRAEQYPAPAPSDVNFKDWVPNRYSPVSSANVPFAPL